MFNYDFIMDDLQDLPLIMQDVLNGINLIGGQWPTIHLDHIKGAHMCQTIDEGQFCYMDDVSLTLVLHAVFLHGKIVEAYHYCGKPRYKIAANLWVPSGFSNSSGNVTHKITVRYCSVDRTIGTAYPGGIP